MSTVPVCGYIIWPYTENNICVLKAGHKGYHKDAKGREFDTTKVVSKPGDAS